MWIDSENALLTDEQVLRRIAAFGSLESAVEHGNITLLSQGQPARTQQAAPSESRRLKDYLREVNVDA